MKITVRSAMKVDVQTVHPAMTIEELEAHFVSDNVGGFPVLDGDQVVGVVSKSDILRQLNADNQAAHSGLGFYSEKVDNDTNARASDDPARAVSEACVRDIMSTNLISVSPNDSLEHAANLMGEKRVHRLLVISSDKLVGIITALDLARVCGDDGVKLSRAMPKTLDF